MEIKVSIQDNVGKLVFEKLINKNEYLPLDLPSGNYIMLFDDGENRVSKAFYSKQIKKINFFT